MTPPPSDHATYQRLLRALGAHLDQAGASRFCTIELPDEFLVVLHGGSTKPQPQEVHLSMAALAEQARQLARGRKLFGSSYNKGWKLASTGHQDLLRALGYELDRADARYILIDELEDGLMVTYSYLDPAQGYNWRKHLMVLQQEDIEQLGQAAHARRPRRIRPRP